jgi:two-component system sensor histidine kinase/response regulator
MSPHQPPVILVIDDEPAIRLGLLAALKRHGYQAVAAENGSDALQKAAELTPDLIVSDVMMPPPDGFELKRLMSRDPALASIPFIFLTARGAVQDRVAGISSGADDYVSKPFEMQELLARIDALLRRVHSAEERGREQMREVARQDMERLQKEILQNFHHELRTPLMNIAMPLELAVNHKFTDPAEQSKFIRMALSNVDKLDSLVADIVILSNIEHGDLNSVRQVISIKDHILAPAQKRLERYRSKNLNFSHEVSGEGEIMAPRREFSQAVLHLVDNAFKFGPQNGVVRLQVRPGADGGGEIEVSDDGAGISIEQRENVFERFYQISQGDSREHDGLGVGLTIARAVFRSLKGDVQILDGAGKCRVLATLPGVGQEDIVYG